MNRDDIQLLRELLQEELKPIKDDIGSLKTEVSSLKADVGLLKTDVSSLKADVGSLKTDVSSLKTDIGSLKTDVGSLKTDMTSLKSQVNENTQILKALEHKSEVNKAEHDKMMNDIAYIRGDIENIKDTTSAIFEMYGEHEAEIIKLKKKIS